MFCGNCGRQLPEGAQVCPQCGTKVAKDIDFSDVTDYASRKVQQAASSVQTQVQSAQQSYKEQFESRKVRDIREMFVAPNEEQRAVIGGGYLDNLLLTGTFSKGFGVLTNLRLYYRANCFDKVGNHFVKTDEDRIVDVSDITSSGFVYTRYIVFLILSILLGMASIFFFIETLDQYAGDATIQIFFFTLFLFVVVVLLYIFFKQTMYTVTYAGGSLSIKASSYNIKDVRAFDKTLHQVKDEYLSRR